ncbi:hypothetical protein NKH91_17830 [Mesorhizobium sp. M0894]|uniref:hypothetical protein n=1 Tax=unclassified Mesorhizobium TaxID=325217 RepID=UPI003334B13B
MKGGVVRIDSLAGQVPIIALHNLADNQMALRINLPGGTLKVKIYRELRDRERERRLPMLKLGSLYLIWWSNKLRR